GARARSRLHGEGDGRARRARARGRRAGRVLAHRRRRDGGRGRDAGRRRRAVTEPPEGYLGATGRIAAGPAPELVAAGYQRELADNDLLAAGMGLSDIAHVLS